MKTRITVSFLILASLICYLQEQKAKPRELICETQKTKNEPELQDIITNTCSLGDLKFVSIGSPDYKGRYSWESKVYKWTGKTYVQKKYSEIFINTALLEKKINDENKKAYESDIKRPEISECMGFIKYRKFSLDEMEINFDELGNPQFTLTYNSIPLVCFNVNATIIPMKLSEFNSYIK